MGKKIFCLTFFVFCLFCLKANAITVTFNDPGLESAVRDALGKPTGDITDTDMASLTSLDAYSRGISDLTGLEYAVNLQELNLNSNQLTDVSPLGNLTNDKMIKRYKKVNQLIEIVYVSPITIETIKSCWNIKNNYKFSTCYI